MRPERRSRDDDEVDLDAAFTMSPREVLQQQGLRDDDRRGAWRRCRRCSRACGCRCPSCRCAARRAAQRGHRDRPARDAAPRRPAPRARCRRSRWRARAAAHAAARRAVRHLGLDGPLCADAAALPARDHQRPATACTCCCSARGSPTSRAISQHRDVDVALARVTTAVVRLGRRHADRRCLDEFNRRWSRRLLGAERRRAADQRRSRRRRAARSSAARRSACTSPAGGSIWLNPLLRYAGFEARPGRHPARCCRTSTISCRCTISTSLDGSLRQRSSVPQPRVARRNAAANRTH